MRGLLLLVVFLAGCAAKVGFSIAPLVMSLGAYVANEKATLWIDSDGCHLVVKFADGQSLTVRPDAAVCVRGELWVKAQAAVPKPAAAAPDGPK